MSNNKLILLDSDVIIHFTKADKLSLLHEHFNKRLLVLQEVYEELSNFPASRNAIDNLIRYNVVLYYEYDLSLRPQILKEYARIKRTHKSDPGESMCMAVARFDNKIIASSNRKDIDPYCTEHNITYMTTLDILYDIFKMGKISEGEFDHFIYNVTTQNSHLSHRTLQDYLKRGKISI